MVELAAGKACFHPPLPRGRTATLTATALSRQMANTAMALRACRGIRDVRVSIPEEGGADGFA
jgi:hypothetical protein